MGNHVPLLQTFSRSCFCERNTGKILIHVEENTSSLEELAVPGRQLSVMETAWGSGWEAAVATALLSFSAWKVVLFG